MCCCCGYNKKSGVIWGFLGAIKKAYFVCEDCFTYPDVFYPCKKYIAPHIVVQRSIIDFLPYFMYKDSEDDLYIGH